MALTRTAVRTRTRTFLYEPTAKSVTDAEINSWIDDACRDISIRTLCNESLCTAIETVSGTKAYNVPTTLNTSAIETIAIKTILNSSAESLQYATPDMIGRTGNEGKNMIWTEWGSAFITSPTPSAVYTLEPMVWQIIGCTAAGTLEIDLKYHHVVPTYCLFAAMLKKREYDAAAATFKLYIDQLAPTRPPSTKRTDTDQSPQD
jgi:hypothetical protein